ncbi:MAG: argininosuccinate lyase [Acidilobaceae archaeon]
MYREKLLGPAEALPLKYTSSLEADKLITCEVLEVVKAYLKGLVKAKAIDESLASSIEAELLKLQQDPSPLWKESVADIHEAVESYLIKKLGLAASQIALGKSRNDQIATALRLKVRTLLYQILIEIKKLRKTVLEQALVHLETPMPAYTHERPAQVTTLAHYLDHIDEMLEDYEKVIISVLDVTNKTPLGAGPVAGTMVPIDRDYVSNLLLFKGLVYNNLYASSSRDFLMLALAVVTSLLVSLSKIAEDLIYFSSPEVRFVELPVSHLDTSSIMPHKRNPVTLEVLRAKAGEAIGRLSGVMAIVKALRSGYNLDLQEANDIALTTLLETRDSLQVLRDILSNMKVNVEAMKKYVETFQPIAAELAEVVTLKTRKPFREVYWEIAKAIRESEDMNKAIKTISEKYGVEISINAVLRKPVVGSPNPETLKRHIENKLVKVMTATKELEEALESMACR